MTKRHARLSAYTLAVALLNCGFAPFAADPVTQGNQLYAASKFEDAIGKYGEALVEDPDSPLLNFNMGAAHYKAGRYEEALASFARANTPGDPKREARIAYNIGNAHFQIATGKESENPKEALAAYAQALIAYRRAVGADPAAEDAKHNYELANKRLLDLKRKLEEQQQQQDQQPQDGEPQEQPPADEPPPEDGEPPPNEDGEGGKPPGEPNQSPAEPPPTRPSKPSPGDDGDESDDGERTEDPQPAGEPPNAPPEGASPDNAAPADATAGGRPEETSPERKQAAAVIDLGADEELRPDEFVRQVQGAGVAEPAQDW